jgi:hypothetical protein
VATLKSKGTPLRGQTIIFVLNGHKVGTAVTNAQGVATLGNMPLTGINAGVNPGAVAAGFSGSVAFQQSSAIGALAVSKAGATISLGGLAQIYDGTVKSVSVSTAPAGNAYTISYTDANNNPVASPIAAGSYHVSAAISSSNYTGSASGTLVIAPASVSVTGITAGNKVYDGTTSATVDTSAAALSGVLAGDLVTLVTSGATGAFDTKAVGSGKTVSITGLTLSGASAGNYIITAPTTTADITAATVTVSGITASTRTCDGTVSASLNTAAASLAGVVAGDDVTLVAAAATGTFATPDVGIGKTVTISGLTLGGTDASNYTLVQPTTTADITAAPVTVTGITAGNKVYDGTTSASIDTSAAALSGVVSGESVTLDTAAATASFASKTAGTGKTVTITGLALSGADAANYTLVQPTATADIAPATVSVSEIAASNKVYDGTTAAAIDASAASLSGVIAGDDVVLSVGGATGVFDTKGVGCHDEGQHHGGDRLRDRRHRERQGLRRHHERDCQYGRCQPGGRRRRR